MRVVLEVSCLVRQVRRERLLGRDEPRRLILHVLLALWVREIDEFLCQTSDKLVIFNCTTTFALNRKVFDVGHQRCQTRGEAVESFVFDWIAVVRTLVS